MSSFSVFIARNAGERREFEALRKQAFPAEQTMPRDPLDEFCDYILVKEGSKLAAGCRLLTTAQAQKAGGFYTATEFDITGLLKAEPNPLELGRFCIADEYRQTGKIFRRFWRSLSSYIVEHQITTLFGCASFPGLEPTALAQEFHSLKQGSLLEEGLVKPKQGTEYFHLKDLPEPKTQGEASHPPLVRSYLNMGGKVSDVGFIDRQFHCIDLCMVVRVNLVPQRYTQQASPS